MRSLTPELLKVFDSVPDLYLILSTDQIILNASNAYLEATFTTREQIVGKYVFDVFPNNPHSSDGNVLSNLDASIREVLSTKKPHRMAVQHYDVPHPTIQGLSIERHWAPSNTPVLDENGEVSYIIHRVEDVTQRLLATRQLKQSQEREQVALATTEAQKVWMERLLMQAPGAICMLHGPNHIYTFVNPAYQQLFPGRQLLGKSLFTEALPELAHTRIEKLLKKVTETGETYIGNEVRMELSRQEGKPLEEIYFNFVYQALFGENGKIEGAVCFAYDVTDMVKARKRAEESHKHSEKLNQELALANTELASTNEELQAAIESNFLGQRELLETHHQLEQLTRELEERVALRTKQMQLAREQAQIQKDHLEGFFMQAPAAICILDGPELVFELVNPLFQQLFPGRILLGKPVLEGLSEIQEQPIHQILLNTYQTGKTYYGKEVLISLAREEGAPLDDRYFNFIYQPRTNATGMIDGIMVFAFEVTEHVKARKAFETSAQQLRLLTDALPVLIGYLDKEEKYRFANKAYEAWFNQKPEELLGHRVKDVVGEKAYNGVKVYIDRALAGERLDFEARMPYRKDFVKYIRTSYVPDIRDGEVVGFYTLVADITESVVARQQMEQREKEAKALAEELSLVNAQLLRINSDLDTFIYTASHDLKAPIINIEGLIKALLRHLPEENLQKEDVQLTIDFIQQAVERFKRTIANLTEVVKLQKESSQQSGRVNLERIIREVQLDLAPQIKEAYAQIEVAVEACPEVEFSEKNLRSIVYNLLSNAIKYHSPDRAPYIHIHCQQTEQYHMLTVADNGLGMNLSGHEPLFSMFKRFHDHVEGSGIGLYMVKRMVENAGGKIEVESKVGEGSTFRVYFKR